MLHDAARPTDVRSHHTTLRPPQSRRISLLSSDAACRAELSAPDRSGFLAALQGIRTAAALANASLPLPLVPQLTNATVEYAARLTLVSKECAHLSHLRPISALRLYLQS